MQWDLSGNDSRQLDPPTKHDVYHDTIQKTQKGRMD